MRKHGAGVNRVAHLHLERAGPQMRVRGEMSVAEILDDVIASESLVRNRHRGLAAVGDVLWNPVLDREDLSVGARVNLLSPCVVVAVLSPVAGNRVADAAKLNPVDRIALADVRLS